MTELSIIIVSFNTRKITINCIESIYNANFKLKFEVIVVDNNSSDDTIFQIKEKFPKVILVENNSNNYFAKANNQGVEKANGKYILLLNSDTIVIKNELEKLVQFLEQSSNKIALVGCTILNEDKSFQSAGYALPSIFERIVMVFKLYKIIRPKKLAQKLLPTGTPFLSNSTREVGWISGCCMLIKKNVFLKLGGLNEALEFYGEEPEFCWRLKENNFQTWIVPEVKIIHLGGGSSNNEFSNHIKDLDKRLFRYSQLQKFTVGYKKAISMSRVVLFGLKIKKIIITDCKKKDSLKNAIGYEKKVIEYLKKCLKKNQ
jgi:GT2 family glycosyltransferase